MLALVALAAETVLSLERVAAIIASLALATPADDSLAGARGRGLLAYALYFPDRPIYVWALFPILGQSAVGIQNDQRLKEFEARALREAEIQPEQSASGFVYFQLPASESNLAGNRVVFVLRDGGGKDLNYEILLAGRRDAISLAVGLARRAGREPATPAEARSILGIR